MRSHFDVIVIGSGPAGQKAAICAAKEGKRVLVVEAEEAVGGACVHTGTIPSKALRETALTLAAFRRGARGVYSMVTPPEIEIAPLMERVGTVIKSYEATIADHFQRNDVGRLRGRAQFCSAREIEVCSVYGTPRRLTADIFVIATGSTPRRPPAIPIDHEHILDSDSVLSMSYQPTSLTVLGGGVIACEYASIFASLGSKVTLVDQGARPLGFFDEELVRLWMRAFVAAGGEIVPSAKVKSVTWDGVSQVVTELEGGARVVSEKFLSAVGRVANVDGLGLANAGLSVSARGLVEVDEHLRTSVAHIYGVGDVIGPPSLASSAMEQGRRAIRHALGMGGDARIDTIPTAIYTIPEMAQVGLDESQARAKLGGCIVGRASFAELARAQIAGNMHGMVKLVVAPDGKKLVGVQIFGDGASELVHTGQMALVHGADVDVFVDHVFNFPTLAEGYRVAALDVVKQRAAVLGVAA